MVNEKANIQVTLNSKEAEHQLEELQNEMKRLIELKKKAEKKGDVEGYKQIDKELKKVTRSASKLVREHESIESTLKNINGASINDLRKAQRSLTAQTNKLNRETKEYTDKRKQLRLVKNEIAKINSEYRQQRGFVSRAADGFNKYFAVITAGAASFAGVILGMRKAIDVFNEFEEASDNLRALTGLGNEQMAYLEKQAENTSHAIIEGGVRIKQSAKDILDAYTLVGSQRPELLKNQEALHEVTQEAIILSEAAKMELEPAAAALANTLNQFNESADQSRRVINILASGSQAGAGNIEYLSKGIEKTGTSAQLMNISIEQTVGALETVAPYYKRAEMAGNSLDKVLLKMKAGNIGYKDGVFDMNRAIDELRERYKNGESAAKIFGVEHAKMGELLVLNQAQFNKYTKAVTGSNKAIEQASINTDNNNAKMAQARNERQIAVKDLGEKLAPAMTMIISKSAMMLKFLTVMVDFFTKYGRTIIVTSSAIAAYTVAVKLAASWDTIHYGLLVSKDAITKAYAFTTGILTGKIKLATVAQRLWNIVQKANPIGLIAGILVGAGVALAAYIKKVNKLTAEQKILNDVEAAANKNIVEQKVKVEELLRIAKNEKLSLDARKKALEDLNKISPQYFGNLTIEKINTEAATTATEAYTKALLKQARVQAAKEKLIELEKQRIDAMQSGSDYEVGFWQSAWNGIKSLGNTSTFFYNQAISGAKNATQAEADYIEQKKTLLGLIDEQNSSTSKTTNTGGSATGGTSPLDALLNGNAETQKEAIRKYFEDAGKDSFEAFIAAIEKAQAGKTIDFSIVPETEEQEQSDPAADYAIEQYKQTLDYKLALNESMYEQGLIGEQQYQDQLTAITKQAEDERFELKRQKIEDAKALTNMAGNFVMALMDLELEKAGDNEEKKKEIRKKYADLNFAVTASQIVANTAGAIMQGFAQLGPIGGAIAAALLGATGVVQLGIANAERTKVKGYAQGKYPDTEYAGRPRTGMYGNKPQLGIFNEVPGQPEMVIDGITTRNINLNYPGIMEAIYAVRDGRKPTPQFADGKYPATPQSPTPSINQQLTSDPELKALIAANTKAMQELKNIQPVIAVETYEKKRQQYNDIEKQSGL